MNENGKGCGGGMMIPFVGVKNELWRSCRNRN